MSFVFDGFAQLEPLVTQPDPAAAQSVQLFHPVGYLVVVGALKLRAYYVGSSNARNFDMEVQRHGSCVGGGLHKQHQDRLRIRHTQVPRLYCVRRDPQRALHVSEGTRTHRVQGRA